MPCPGPGPPARDSRYKSGTDCATQHHPTFLQATARARPPRPSGQRPPSHATSANAARPKQNMPSPGGQASGMTGHQRGRGWAGCGQGVASRRPPQGYHTAPQWPAPYSTARSPILASVRCSLISMIRPYPGRQPTSGRTKACDTIAPPGAFSSLLDFLCGVCYLRRTKISGLLGRIV